MNCEYARANAVLYCYDELPDDVRHEFNQHIQRCAECAAEVDAVRGLHGVMAMAERAEPSANLLAASRIRLQEALETTQALPAWRRWLVVDVSRLMQSVKLAPAMAAVLVICGFGLGVGTTYRLLGVRGSNTAGGMVAAPAAEASIAGIRSINPEPGSNNVQIKYDKLVPDTAQGSLDDPRIQQLLVYASRSNMNSGLRMDATDLLSQKSGDERVRQELVYSLHNDSNVGVRLRAIEALQPFVKQDVRVRDGVLEALMNDASPGVRTEAIHALEPVKSDSSVRHVLETLERSDKNQYIRHKAQELLNTAPEMN
ncbi:MAG: HEAT repeat domain-containing protein [Acidobacteria bacterium]|nr:HEAT repeat domain-containing protein [Acidobacteriota bacterium]